EGDVVLCLDVLIHQATEPKFFNLLNRLISATRERLIVTGYDAPPSIASEITRYYLPITEALRRTAAFETIEILGSYQDIVVVAADRAQSGTIVGTPSVGNKKSTLGKVVVGSGWWCDGNMHEWG